MRGSVYMCVLLCSSFEAWSMADSYNVASLSDSHNKWGVSGKG